MGPQRHSCHERFAACVPGLVTAVSTRGEKPCFRFCAAAPAKLSHAGVQRRVQLLPLHVRIGICAVPTKNRARWSAFCRQVSRTSENLRTTSRQSPGWSPAWDQHSRRALIAHACIRFSRLSATRRPSLRSAETPLCDPRHLSHRCMATGPLSGWSKTSWAVHPG